MFGEDPGRYHKYSTDLIILVTRSERMRGSFKGMYEIRSDEVLCIKMTSFSIDHENEDVNLSVARVVRSGGQADQSGR